MARGIAVLRSETPSVELEEFLTTNLNAAKCAFLRDAYQQ
jgi:hypothetical protein